MLRVIDSRSIQVQEVEAVFRGVTLPMGLRVEKVTIRATNIEASHDPLTIRPEQPGHLEVFVSEVDLADFLNRSGPVGMKNVSVQAHEGTLHIRATKTVVIDVRIYVVCALRIVERSKVYIDLESADLMGVGTKQLMQTQIDKINPVIDCKDFPIPSELESVEVIQGGILMKGRVSPPENYT